MAISFHDHPQQPRDDQPCNTFLRLLAKASDSAHDATKLLRSNAQRRPDTCVGFDDQRLQPLNNRAAQAESQEKDDSG